MENGAKPFEPNLHHKNGGLVQMMFLGKLGHHWVNREPSEFSGFLLAVCASTLAQFKPQHSQAVQAFGPTPGGKCSWRRV